MKLTTAQHKALTILKDTSWTKGITARQFAEAMWGESHPSLFTRVSNTGNGACSGKASWLCAGSYLAKLRKKGWTAWDYRYGYCITPEGRDILNRARL